MWLCGFRNYFDFINDYKEASEFLTHVNENQLNMDR